MANDKNNLNERSNLMSDITKKYELYPSSRAAAYSVRRILVFVLLLARLLKWAETTSATASHPRQPFRDTPVTLDYAT